MRVRWGGGAGREQYFGGEQCLAGDVRQLALEQRRDRLLELDPTLRCPLRVDWGRSDGEDSRSGGKKCMLHLESSVSSSAGRSEEHTSELQSLMRISYAVFCLKKKKTM